jgi:hypothetical protein
MEQLPLSTEREFLEDMSPRALAKFVLYHSAQISESERWIGMANDVLLGLGTSIDLELEKIYETHETAGPEGDVSIR